jgi:hypothetical protein
VSPTFFCLVREDPPLCTPSPPSRHMKQNGLMVQTTAFPADLLWLSLCPKRDISSEGKWGVGTHTAVCFMLLSSGPPSSSSDPIGIITTAAPDCDPSDRHRGQEWLLARVISFASIPISRFHPPTLGPLPVPDRLSWWLIVGALSESCSNQVIRAVLSVDD